MGVGEEGRGKKKDEDGEEALGKKKRRRPRRWEEGLVKTRLMDDGRLFFSFILFFYGRDVDGGVGIGERQQERGWLKGGGVRKKMKMVEVMKGRKKESGEDITDNKV